ncbi:diacylglycerol kinase [Sphingomonas sp. NBWT7]|uniref:diacylglycerol/lipid kinase family protein n=1 Tax=Sphingomonas sp. NBWT7 TaxID=2596913 RepID=UPI0016281344|nr:diacylglycerol kinase family protein [Sphingomonas sp. NBWT7]QNE32211.1 diacylglycerol kinase [Sphingomonas sp. NBWT7]
MKPSSLVESPLAGALRFDAGTLSSRVRDEAVERRTRFAAPHSLRVGVILNQRAHRNLASERMLPAVSPQLDWAAPNTMGDLSRALARFATNGIDLLVIDGGDGTIRDTLSAAHAYFPAGLPPIALVPSGKTNALALDVGVPSDWTVHDAIAAANTGRIVRRTPIEITREGEDAPSLSGFIFGAGAFVKATALAQQTHRLGAFKGLAVGMSLLGAIAQTLFAGRDNAWRRGVPVGIELEDGRTLEQDLYLLLASTLERLPLGIKPFGAVRDGLKVLGVDAPPRQLLTSFPAVLAGSEAAWLERLGYHRRDFARLTLSLSAGFILDGEQYPGSRLTLARGRAIDFIVP